MRKIVLLIGAVALLLGCWYGYKWMASRSVVAPTAIAPVPKPAVRPTAQVAVEAPTKPSEPIVPKKAPPISEARTQAINGTQQMILAHASLRAPEVTNPDSETNRQVLQTMVAKALARARSAAETPAK